MRRRIVKLLPMLTAWVLLSSVPAFLATGDQHSSLQQQAATRPDGQQKQMFEGTITRSDEKLILQDHANGATYKLDDQQLAAFFEGKEVKVSGTLDSKTETIYISDIGLSHQRHAAAARAAFHRNRPRTRMLQYGVASWYERRNQSPRTASGEPFDERALTAAHRRLPLGTRVKVTNLRNGRSVLVRINDRGPFVPGRLIDVSKGAAERLGFKHQGLTRVRTSVVSFPHGNPTS